MTSNEQEVPEIEVSDDPYSCKRIDVSNAPCLVTVSKVCIREVLVKCCRDFLIVVGENVPVGV